MARRQERLPGPRRRISLTFVRFLRSEASGGVILMASAAAALIVANSPLAEQYHRFQETRLGPLSVLHWINDGLMSLFFLLVGLEIKRELLDGHLQEWSARLLPGAAALGGMIAPALIYVAVNASSPETMRGWAIPSATDIAFALGVLTLLGSSTPSSLKAFLTALAILDDLGAIVIIGAYYTADLAATPLALSGVALFLLLGLNIFGVKWISPYLLIGGLLWYAVEHSGIHATLAGVLLAATLPLKVSGIGEDEQTPLHRMENALQPWVALLVIPLFGFANAGVTIGDFEFSVSNGLVLTGVAAGLFFGKQVGVFGTVGLLLKTGLAARPAGASWAQIYGVSTLCGVGFTMSLFIGHIAFGQNSNLMAQTKVGVLGGSLLSILLGALVLRLAGSKKLSSEDENGEGA